MITPMGLVEKKEILESYCDDLEKSWEERYRALEEHHLAETQFLIKKIRDIVVRIPSA